MNSSSKSLINLENEFAQVYKNFKIINNTLYTMDDFYINLNTLQQLGFRITNSGKLMRKNTRGNGRLINYNDSEEKLAKLEKLQRVINSDDSLGIFNDERSSVWRSKKII